MNWYRAVVLALVVLAAGACGSGSSATAPAPVRTHGVLVRVGGPPPGAPVALAGVEIHFQSATQSAGVRTDRHGRFAFAIAPGTYTVRIGRGGFSPVTVPRVVHVPHTGPLRLVENIR